MHSISEHFRSVPSLQNVRLSAFQRGIAFRDAEGYSGFSRERLNGDGMGPSYHSSDYRLLESQCESGPYKAIAIVNIQPTVDVDLDVRAD